MQRFALEIERGRRKKDRLEAGANYPDTLHRTVKQLHADLPEAENETLVFDPDTGQTTMKDPARVNAAPPRLRTQIVKLAQRLAFLENKLFARIFRLDEHIGRIRAFLSRTDIAPDVKKDAQAIVRDVAGDEPGLG